MKKHLLTLTVLFAFVSLGINAQWDQRPTTAFTAQYSQDFTGGSGTWDDTAFYDQWLTVDTNNFTATDISNGYLEFAWVSKRIMVSNAVYYPPYKMETNVRMAGAAGGFVLRANPSVNEQLQETGVGNGFNREGIAIYRGATDIVVQFSGVENGTSTPITQINVALPSGVTDVSATHIYTVEDYGSSIYVFIDAIPFARIDLGDLSGSTYTSGTVYEPDMTVAGTFTGMEVETTGKLSFAQRASGLQLSTVAISTIWDQRPATAFTAQYSQDFTGGSGTWDGTTFYNQWSTIGVTAFSATDIASNTLVFEWPGKRVLVSTAVYTPPYRMETNVLMAGAAGGIVLRANPANNDSFQDPGDGNGFNSEGIAIYPGATDIVVQFSGVENGASTPITKINVPLPSGVTGVNSIHKYTVEDYGSSIYINIDAVAFARIDLDDLSGNTYTSGTVYQPDMTVAGTFTGMEVDDDGKLGFAQRASGLNLNDVAIETGKLNSTTWSGATDSDWSTSSNWSNGIPVATSDLLIPSSLTNYPTASGTVTVNSVIMESGSSLIAQSTFTGSVTYNRNLATTNWYLVSSPVVGETYDDAYVTANSIASGTQNTNSRGIAPYVITDDSWDYMQSGETATFTSGNGYSVKRSATGDISFTGTLNVADVGVTLSNAGNRFNLLGNPYTSHIASATFLTNEAAVSETQTLWVWNQATGASGAYEVKTISDAMVIAPAQGFFVKANAAGGTFNFAESNQASTGGTFQRTANRPEIYLSISNQTDAREAKIYFIDNMTSGFDVGYEGELFNGVSNPLAIYTHLVADSEGKNYQVQSLPTNNYENMIVPVGVNATSGSAITIDASTNNLPEGVNIYLEDKQDNSFTLLNADTNFNSTLENNLSGIGRFYLHTTSESLSTGALGIGSNISIYKSSSDNLRIVGVKNSTANVQMYNMLGKEVLKTSFEGNGVNDIKLINIPTGVYILKIALENGTINKKIIIQ